MSGLASKFIDSILDVAYQHHTHWHDQHWPPFHKPLLTTVEFKLNQKMTFLHWFTLVLTTGSPLRGGDVAVYVFDINQPSLPTPFYFVLVSASVFMALSTVFHSINSSDNSLLYHSVIPVLFLPC